jgi:DNA repair protein RadC
MKVREVSISYKGRGRVSSESITDPAAAVKVFGSFIPDHVREHFMALYLDGRGRPIGYRVISTGTANASLVHPREVFQAGVLLGAVSLIVAHNHPSGDPSPSAEDRDVTARLRQAGEILGISLLDSLVFTESGTWSQLAARIG